MSARPAAWIPRLIFVVEGLVIGVLGLLGLLLGHAQSLMDSESRTSVLFFHLSPLHSLILLLAGVAAIVLSLFRRTAGAWAILQFIGFGMLFVYGTAEPQPLGLDTVSHFLHLTLMVLGAALGLVIAAPSLGSGYHQPHAETSR